MIGLVKVTFVYKNQEEITLEAEVGQSLFDLAVRNNIQMSKDTKGTCLVQIQLPIKGNDSPKLHEPTLQEKQILDPSQIDSGYRYADTYIIDDSFNSGLVFLNIYRVYYKKRNGEIKELNPYEGESLIGVKKRRTNDIDSAYSCGGSMSCVSCHCILDVTEEEFKKVKRPISNMEFDQLDWADATEPTSRLGCQVVIDNSIQWDKRVIRNPYAKNN